jgi:hypothetical protein
MLGKTFTWGRFIEHAELVKPHEQISIHHGET